MSLAQPNATGCIQSCRYNAELDKCESCGRSMQEIKDAYAKGTKYVRQT